MRCLAILSLVGLAGCSSLTAYQPETYVVRSGDTLYSIAFRHGLDAGELARWNRLNNPDRLAVGQRLVLSPAAQQSQAPVPRQSSPVRAAMPAPRFDWPTEGQLVARFGDRGVLTTGIAIAGRLGQAIVAAAPGRVVYAGSGLVDYGELVIIEHNSNWLSAYGHSQRLIVSQGQTVDRGQPLGEMGLGPERKPELYFEVRQDGRPLDPLRFLPASR